jgi:outer membrane receptor for ferrienterochelin and colicins
MSPMFRPVRSIALATALAAPVPAFAQQVDYAQLAELMGEPITTSVTGKPQRASQAPAAITIITREQIARSPARDVPGLLKTYAGIDVNRWTAGGSDVNIRGGVQPWNPRLLVLVNGRQVYLDHYGMTNWNLLGIQLEEIQQIELVRGPAGALFGFNAASGVVNIITVDATSNRLSGSAEIGGHGYNRLSMVGGLAIGDRAGVRLSAGRLREDERRIPSEINDPGTGGRGVEREDVSGTFTATLGEGTDITANGGYAHSHQLEILVNPVLTGLDVKTGTAGAIVSHDTGWGSLDARSYVNWLDYVNSADNLLPGLAAATRLDVRIKNRIIVNQASLLARVGAKTTIRIGGEYRVNRVRSAVYYSPEISYAVLAGSAMIDAHPTDRLALTAAARIDRLKIDQKGAPDQPQVDPTSAYDRGLTTLSFNGAALLDIGGAGQLRVNGGRAIESPSLSALGLHLQTELPGIPFPLVLAGNPALKPATVWSGEIGYARTVGQFKVDTGLFYSRIENFIAFPNQASFSVGATGLPLLLNRFGNVGDLEALGARTSLSGATGRWSGHLNYSWTYTDYDHLRSNARTTYILGADKALARHKINAELTYDARRWFVTGVGRYTSATDQLATMPDGQLRAFGIPDTVALDGKLGWRITPKLTASIAGENLTNARGATGSPIPADRRLRAGIAFEL